MTVSITSSVLPSFMKVLCMDTVVSQVCAGSEQWLWGTALHVFLSSAKLPVAYFPRTGTEFCRLCKVYIGTRVCSRCFFCFLWLRKIYSYILAIRNSCIRLVPYWFVDIFIRGSVGESLAMGCFTLLLYAIAGKKGVLIASLQRYLF